MTVDHLTAIGLAILLPFLFGIAIKLILFAIRVKGRLNRIRE